MSAWRGKSSTMSGAEAAFPRQRVLMTQQWCHPVRVDELRVNLMSTALRERW